MSCEYKEICEKITFGASEGCNEDKNCYPYKLIDVNFDKIYNELKK